MPSPQITLAQVIELPVGTRGNPSYIDGEFEVSVLQAYPPKGRMPSSMNVCDPHNPAIKAKVKMFARNLEQYKGKLVRIGGNGNKRDEYNGTPEIVLSTKSADIHVLGTATTTSAPAAAPATRTRSAAPAAAGKTRGFHAEMKRLALFYRHCLNYAKQIEEKHGELSEQQRVECVRAMFIEGVKLGLPDRAPAVEAGTEDAPEPEPAAAPPAQETRPPVNPPAAKPKQQVPSGPDGSVALDDDPDADVPF